MLHAQKQQLQSIMFICHQGIYFIDTIIRIHVITELSPFYKSRCCGCRWGSVLMGTDNSPGSDCALCIKTADCREFDSNPQPFAGVIPSLVPRFPVCLQLLLLKNKGINSQNECTANLTSFFFKLCVGSNKSI